MERAQQHRFIDLAAPAPDDAGEGLKRRREFMRRLGVAAFAASATPAAFAQAIDRYAPGAPPVRYPEPDVIGLDKRFKYKLGNTPILRLYRGTMWAEGPAWNHLQRVLRRQQAQPAVHDRQPVAVRGLRRDPRRNADLGERLGCGPARPWPRSAC